MQDIFGEQLKEQRIYLHKIIEEKRRALEDAPKGRLRCKKNHERQEYYWVTDRENTIGRYLLVDQQDLVKTLAQKAYDLKALGFAEEEYKRLCALEKYREAHPLESAYEQYSPARKALVRPIVLSDEEYITRWKSRQHTVLGFEEGAPEFYTKAGLRVRSKSEIIIAERLDDLVLPYIFEFPVYLPDRGWVFPDFTILNVRLRKAYLWEHLGRMDDPGYLVSNISKLKSYEKEGYYMGDNLIVTFETKDSPIDTRQVDRLIKHFLM